MKKILSLIFAVLMLVSVIPTAVFSQDGYTVTLHAGPEGQGADFTLTKKQGEALELAHLRADVTAAYGLEPKGGNSDQRVFIMWAEGYDATTARGTGNTYFDSFDEDRDVELYAIWGYPIMFNADGGRYADGSTRKLQYVANYANWNGDNTDPKSRYKYNMPDWNGDVPVKEGARRVGNGAGPDGLGYAYGLVRADGKTVYTWEGYGENLTIPPVGGAMAWSDFHCVAADDPDNPYGIAFPEFIAIWEPSVTYDPNGGAGESYSEYMTFDWVMWKYEYYTIDRNSFTREGYKFIGWNTEPDGSGRSYTENRRITNTPGKDSDPFTLYAQWELDHVHDYSSEIAVEPTCGADGTMLYTCFDCGDSYTETLPATGEHNYESVTTEPTCAEEGETIYTCSVCDDSYSETLPATDEHSYGEWSVTDKPTYLKEGREERVCGVCSAIEERSIPMLDYVNPFTDVKESYWFASTVEYCVKHGYVNGMTPTTFVPSGSITRAQFLVMLAALDGVDLDAYAGKDSGFTDVKPSHWWNEEVCWAVENGITSGISETKFGPNNMITRSQLARFFYVYAEKNEIPVDGREDLTVFPDASKVQEWAETPVEWAVAAGIINGVEKDGQNILDPNGTATRAQATVMFKAFDDFRGING